MCAQACIYIGWEHLGVVCWSVLSPVGEIADPTAARCSFRERWRIGQRFWSLGRPRGVSVWGIGLGRWGWRVVVVATSSPYTYFCVGVENCARGAVEEKVGSASTFQETVVAAWVGVYAI